MFERWSTSFPSACSGDRYSGTPKTVSVTGTRRHEVDDLHLVVRADEHVLGGEVVVDDADLLSFEQRLADLGDDLLGAVEREAAPRRATTWSSGCPSHELADDEQLPVGLLAEVEDAREARALRALELLELALRALDHRRRRSAPRA